MSFIREVRKYPFLRLLLPLIGGIIIADNLFFENIRISAGWSFLSLGIWLIILIMVFFVRRYNFHHFYGLLVFCFFINLGFVLTYGILNHTEYSFPEEETVYKAIIISNGEKKPRSILYEVRIIEHYYDSVYSPVNRNALLYFSPDSLSGTIHRGDVLLFSGRLALPKNNGNPDEFDYPRYLIRKGISGSGFVASGNWRISSQSTPFSLQEKAFQCRDVILDIYRQSGFTGENFAVLSALTVGYKEELSEEIRESFSISGVSHVLALSGLHVGFIFALLFFLLKRIFGSSHRAMLIRAILTVVSLWFFAFVTGLSASVVRSVIMFSLLALTSVRSGIVLTGHSLTFAAFLMLVYNPEWLFDVGFQLSFTAVLGIVLIQPRLYALWDVNNPILKYIWGLLTVSLAAQIATAPLVIYYFSRVGTHFLLTNLVVIPLVTLIIYGAVLLLLVFSIPGLYQGVAWILQLLVETLNCSVRWAGQLPYASIDNIWLTPVAVFVIYLFLFLMALNTRIRKAQRIILALCFVIFLSGNSIWLKKNTNTQPTIAFYNIRQCPAVHCIDNKHSWLAYADSIPENTYMLKPMANYWNRIGINKPEHVFTDYQGNNFTRIDNFISFSGNSILILNDNRWNGKWSDSRMAIDYLYICQGFNPGLESVLSVFSVRQIVLDASLPVFVRECLRNESMELGIPCFSLTDGAFIINL